MKSLGIEKGVRKNNYVIYDNYAEVFILNRAKELVARVKVDLEDVPILEPHRWHLSHYGYVECSVLDAKRKQVRMHRYIMGVDEKNIHVDHINHDKVDNRKENLRVCNNKENSRNKGYARSNSGFIGVSYSKRDDVYQANIKVDYKKIFLGQSRILSEAIKMRLKAEIKYFGEFAPQKHLFEEYGIGVKEYV